MLRITLKNVGTEPVKQEHILKPIRFIFNENSELIDCSIVRTNPEEIGVKPPIIEGKNVVTCTFDLLNPGESITLQFVFSGDPGIPKISTRIVGLSKIDCLTEEEAVKAPILGNMLIALGIGCILGGLIIFVLNNVESFKQVMEFTKVYRVSIPKEWEPMMFVVFNIVLGLFLVVLGVLSHIQYRKYKNLINLLNFYLNLKYIIIKIIKDNL